MTRAQIASKISEATGISKKEAEIVIEGFISVVIDCMRKNGTIEIRGFGTFKNIVRKPIKARNPKTGESLQLGTRYIPKFKVSKEFNKTAQESLIKE
jgi:nucleoid DNA-binding protein